MSLGAGRVFLLSLGPPSGAERGKEQMRFFDELINMGYRFPNNALPIVFNVSNIFQYYFQRPSDDVIEFPNLAPPFKYYFMEATAPAWAMFSGKRHNWIGSPKWGALFVAHADPLHSWEEGKGAEWRKIIEYCKQPEQIKWVINSVIFLVNEPTSRPDPFGQIVYALDNEGKRIDLGNEKYYLLNILPHQLKKIPDISPKIQCETLLQFLSPFEWATCFLHCKNIEISDVVPDEKLNSIHEKKYGHPLVRYKILNITPMQKKRSPAHKPMNNHGQALHICRGHFKRFEEKPLFGKYSGLFWWEYQIRGNRKHGIILKDYKVNL